MRLTSNHNDQIVHVDLGERFPMMCKVGDRVILPGHTERVTMDPDDQTSEVVIVQESQLLGILRDQNGDQNGDQKAETLKS
jgi:hypothetical protein